MVILLGNTKGCKYWRIFHCHHLITGGCIYIHVYMTDVFSTTQDKIGQALNSYKMLYINRPITPLTIYNINYRPI